MTRHIVEFLTKGNSFCSACTSSAKGRSASRHVVSPKACAFPFLVFIPLCFFLELLCCLSMFRIFTSFCFPSHTISARQFSALYVSAHHRLNNVFSSCQVFRDALEVMLLDLSCATEFLYSSPDIVSVACRQAFVAFCFQESQPRLQLRSLLDR